MSARIADNLRRIQERIAAAIGRARFGTRTVTLIAVTKSVGIPEIETLASLGITHFAENRVHLAEPKINAINGDFVWHMIGNIQRRKARDVVRLFQRVDAVDRWELAEELSTRADVLGAQVPVLMEVNVSGEASKHGMTPEAVRELLPRLATLNGLKVEGLMTMAPFFDDPELTRPVFRALRTLADELGLRRVSMGMSNDFEIAIEEGATEVRVGTALFEG